MRRATVGLDSGFDACVISIHALHEESDVSAALSVPVVGISIHALHEESDHFYSTGTL